MQEFVKQTQELTDLISAVIVEHGSVKFSPRFGAGGIYDTVFWVRGLNKSDKTFYYRKYVK